MDFYKKIETTKTILMDMDGTLTDGKIHYTFDGKKQYRSWSFNVKDGDRISKALEKGLKVIIITKSFSPIISERFENHLKCMVLMGVKDKLGIINDAHYILGIDEKIKLNECLYVGDDLGDYEIMKKCLWCCCPRDSHKKIKEISWVSSKNGGDGVFQEIWDTWFNNAQGY